MMSARVQAGGLVGCRRPPPPPPPPPPWALCWVSAALTHAAMLCFLQRQQLAQPPRAHDSACHLRQDGPALAQPTGPSRSALLRLALLAASATLPPLGAPHPAHAAAAAAAALPPIRPAAAAAAAGGPRSSLLLDPQLLPMPPGPIAFPRRQLDLNFAVLLLRSGYEACDDLDFVPMVSGRP